MSGDLTAQGTPAKGNAPFTWWALLVATLYCLILIALTLPTIVAAFVSKESGWPTWSEAGEVYGYWHYWTWLGIMVVGQVALLVVPVRVASRRPVTQRSLWPTILGAGFMAGGLAVGACYSIYEVILRDQARGDWLIWGAIAVWLLTWGFWATAFFWISRGAEPADLVSKQCRLLCKGSILELLIAVPTHIIARHRDYCCAGFMTFLGLTMGIAVMLFSFGPSVYFLFVERWRRLHPLRVKELGVNKESSANAL